MERWATSPVIAQRGADPDFHVCSDILFLKLFDVVSLKIKRLSLYLTRFVFFFSVSVLLVLSFESVVSRLER